MGMTRFLSLDDRRCSQRNDDVDPEPDELGSHRRVTVIATLGPAIIDRDGAILNITELAQALHENGDQVAPCGGARAEDADGRQLSRLLRSGRERPRCGRPAEQGDELATPHSITSSARPSNAIGKVRPSVLALVKCPYSAYH
jgi:hypothetical protein